MSVRDQGFVRMAVCRFATQPAQSPLPNACDTNHTDVAGLRKDWLPERETYRGPHTRLRETAQSLRG
ncbi:hypothetical protein [Streptomyces sp. NPDC058964]|uniref:hypothetical protein n=1 Tax=Streptomyces sp. NPDC058964 TaxID=3346681 RepID=UPI0036CA5E74